MRITFGYYAGGRKKALTMSYDDGQTYDRQLIDIFNRYGIKGTFHLNSGNFNTEPFLSSSEIKALFRGHEVAAHSLTHPKLTLVPKEELLKEIMEDRRNLENLVGYPVHGISYPFGDYNRQLQKALQLMGIEYSRTVEAHGGFHLPRNFLRWHPTCHHDDNLMEKLALFQSERVWDQMPLLYVWGHSFEFARNNNWNMISEFCRTVEGDENVWFATNIEIMDYVTALRSLKFSVNENIVFNPSAISVWLGVDGEAVEIKAGETLQL